MPLHLTPQMLVGAYEFLRTTEPYASWKLPHSDDIEFHVARTRAFMGLCVQDGKRITIRISAARVGHTDTLISTMAHEMVHVWQVMRRHGDDHGRSFRAARKKICAIHGFDPAAF